VVVVEVDFGAEEVAFVVDGTANRGRSRILDNQDTCRLLQTQTQIIPSLA
jgi:hypothetical protein